MCVCIVPAYIYRRQMCGMYMYNVNFVVCTLHTLSIIASDRVQQCALHILIRSKNAHISCTQVCMLHMSVPGFESQREREREREGGSKDGVGETNKLLSCPKVRRQRSTDATGTGSSPNIDVVWRVKYCIIYYSIYSIVAPQPPHPTSHTEYRTLKRIGILNIYSSRVCVCVYVYCARRI